MSHNRDLGTSELWHCFWLPGVCQGALTTHTHKKTHTHTHRHRDTHTHRDTIGEQGETPPNSPSRAHPRANFVLCRLWRPRPSRAPRRVSASRLSGRPLRPTPQSFEGVSRVQTGLIILSISEGRQTKVVSLKPAI